MSLHFRDAIDVAKIYNQHFLIIHISLPYALSTLAMLRAVSRAFWGAAVQVSQSPLPVARGSRFQPLLRCCAQRLRSGGTQSERLELQKRELQVGYG